MATGARARLLDVGRPRARVAALWRHSADLLEGKVPDRRAYALLRCAEILLQLDEPSDARECLWSALDILCDGPDEHLFARATHALGNAQMALGWPGDAAQAHTEAREHYMLTHDVLAAARAERNLGFAFFRMLEVDAALDAMRRARDSFSSCDDNGRAIECGLTEAKMLRDVGRTRDSIRVAEEIREVATDLGSSYLVGLTEHALAAAYARAGEPEIALGLFARSERRVRLRDRRAHASLRIDLAFALRSDGHSADALRVGEQARRFFRRRRDQKMVGHVDRVTARLIAKAGRSDAALRRLREARALADAERDYMGVAECDFERAEILRSVGRSEEALDAVLSAVAAIDRLRYSLVSPAARKAVQAAFSNYLELALELSAETSSKAVVVELIESVRVQTLPVGQARFFPKYGSNDQRHAQQTGRLPMLPYETVDAPDDLPLLSGTPLTVSGTSALADARERLNAVESRDRDVALEDVIRSVGGDAAIWWGSCVVRGRLWWCLVDVESSAADAIHFGWVDAGPDAPLAVALGDVSRSLPQGRDDDDVDLLARSAYGTARKLEADISDALGRALLPTRLARQLASAIEPVSLVLAVAPEIADVPFPLIAVSTAQSQAPFDAPRLIERAILRHAPAAVLVDASTKRAARVEKAQLPVEVGLAVLDPDDSLPFARPAVPGTAKLLVGPKALTELPPDQADVATRHALREALGATPTHSVFVFCGHATMSDDQSPAGAALVLADGQTLAARELLAPMPKSHEYALPARTLLSACATAGAHTREWLGLGPACLWAGSSSVVVTIWPTLDSAGTARMDERLIEALRSSCDVASALRDIQLQELRAWKESIIPTDPTGADAKEALETIHAPYLWAPYICLGIQHA